MADFTFDLEDPLARCPAETKKAHLALIDYAHQGPGRSLRKLHQAYISRQGSSSSRVDFEPPTKRLATLETWSAKYNWVDRVAQFDHLQTQDKAAEYQQRLADFQDRLFNNSEELLARAEAVLSFPLTEEILERDEEGRELVILRPINFNLRDAATLLETAEKLVARISGQPTYRIELDQNVKGSLDHSVVGRLDHELSDAELNDRIHQLLLKYEPPRPPEPPSPSPLALPEPADQAPTPADDADLGRLRPA